VLQKEPPQWWASMEDRELVSATSKQHFSVLRTGHRQVPCVHKGNMAGDVNVR
jgi:hypothetical protein